MKNPITFTDDNLVKAEAIRWTGRNLRSVIRFIGDKKAYRYSGKTKALKVRTPTGMHFMPSGKWLIKREGSNGFVHLRIQTDRDIARFLPRGMRELYIDPVVRMELDGE